MEAMHIESQTSEQTIEHEAIHGLQKLIKESRSIETQLEHFMTFPERIPDVSKPGLHEEIVILEEIKNPNLSAETDNEENTVVLLGTWREFSGIVMTYFTILGLWYYVSLV